MAKLCPKCNSELEELRACGAVNYFCNDCNELVSKKAIIDSEATEVEDQTTHPENNCNRDKS